MICRNVRKKDKDVTVSDDTEVLWGDWRLNDDADAVEECLDPIGRSPIGPNEDYMLGRLLYSSIVSNRTATSSGQRSRVSGAIYAEPDSRSDLSHFFGFARTSS
jgi:hypothetical protein